ncbi:uncharacterized protein MELLADRAFT_103436 [Melampsora larici-populina 98AG31]|uniref:Secreted protein n=1 Tax=Melampsora larici-populina (strain 98AG31 / pathotype 3-4-7) TaxID=747676 RepID=F4RBG4_MELLP|nr:uncharacterized protein MELLADRAFT_103436 [Melampsora larici-populina 98AG31]EGG10081.1 hypothetical protein MELLADRAFT_103436 [Melampsora larici-populina 98AG31]
MRLQLALIALAFRYSFTSVLSFPTNGIESSPQSHLSRSIHRRAVDAVDQLDQLAQIKKETSLESFDSIFSADGVVSYKGSVKRRPRVFTYINGGHVPVESPAADKINAETIERQLRDDTSDPQKSSSEVSSSDNHIDSKTGLQIYSKEWSSKDLLPDVMIRFGEALGIDNKEVKPLTGQSFDVLKALPSELGWDEKQAKLETAQVLEWYRTNKVASLAPDQQQVLDFNLAIANLDHRPWWTEDNMKAWQTTNMPWETITRVGSILERKVKDSMSPEELNNVRSEILTVLDHFAAHNDIEENIEGNKIQSRGAIAEALHEVTGANKASKLKTDYPDFDEKLKLIGPQHGEIAKIKIFLNNQNGEQLDLNKEFRVLVHMQLLLNGIPYDIAEKYARAYKTVSSHVFNKPAGLLSGIIDFRQGAVDIKALKDILPVGSGGDVARITTYAALKRFFQDIYGNLDVNYVNERASVLLRQRTKVTGWVPNIWS